MTDKSQLITRIFNLAAVTAALLIFHPHILGSEQLTVTTYYPAPYGGYARILTTGQTQLARDGGNVLMVQGGGSVGIGTGAPGKKLDIQGGSLRVSGKIGSLNFDPDAGYPGGWGGGIHSWDIFAEGSIGTGPSNSIAWVADRNGNMIFVNPTGSIYGLCRSVWYGVGGETSCNVANGEVAVSSRGAGWIQYWSGTAWGSDVFYEGGGTEWYGWLFCCKLP